MGLIMGLLGKGVPTPANMSEFLMVPLYRNFLKMDATNFEEFRIAVLELFNTFNMALPGKHIDNPTLEDIEECYTQWKQAKDTRKQIVFVNFMKKNVNLNKLDDYTVITGLVTPPVAMAAKRAGENMPKLNIIKRIPDVVFVPSATLLALIAVQLSRRILSNRHDD